MKLIVGLGNFGTEFENTRHNLGFLTIEQLAKKLNTSSTKKKFNGIYYKGQDFFLLKPITGMNLSGECVKMFVEYYQISNKNLLIIHDDLFLPLCSFRFRKQGGDGGHNGLKNIFQNLKTTNLQRLKIGIGNNASVSYKIWVLQNFSNNEKKKIVETLKEVTEGIIRWIKHEIDFFQLMNIYNNTKKNK